MFRLTLMLLVTLSFAGCASVNKQAFNREAATELQALVIAQEPNQELYEAAVIGHAGESFGLIGGLIAMVDIQSKSKQLTQAIDPSKTRLQERLAEKLSEELREAGYQTTVMPIGREASEDKVLEQARSLGGHHAVLHTQMSGGYWAAGHVTNYVPKVFMRARLVELKSGQVLFEDIFSYGYRSPGMESIHLAADSRFTYADIGKLSNSADLARQGLIDGVNALAKQIANDLKRQ